MKYTQELKHFRILKTQFPLLKLHEAASPQQGDGKALEACSVLAGDWRRHADDSGGHTRGSASSCCLDVDRTDVCLSGQQTLEDAAVAVSSSSAACARLPEHTGMPNCLHEPMLMDTEDEH